MPEISLLSPRTLTSLASPQAGTLPPAGKRLGNLLWNGPNSWLLLDDDAAPFAARTTDQSDGFTLIAVSGPDAVATLKKLLSIDVERFGADDVALTQAAHIPVKLWREEGTYVLACFRSYANSLHHALAHAARG